MTEEFSNTYVVVWDATVGLKENEGGLHEPVRLSFVSTVNAHSKQEAEEQLVVYSDPSFLLRVERIEELGEDMSREELEALLEHSRVFNLQPA